MKKIIRPKSHEQLIRDYPITDLVAGQYFKIKEISPGGYQVEGVDEYGRVVSATGSDEKELLSKCGIEANEIKQKIKT